MTTSKDFGERYHEGTVELARVEGKPVNDAEIGRRVSTLLGGTPKCGPSTVQNWRNGSIPEKLDTIAAIAKVLGVDPGWLAFGDESEAPAPAVVIASRADQSSLVVEHAANAKSRRRKKARK